MQKRKLLVTMKDIQRYRILKDVIEKKLRASQAAELLKLSYVHISRLKKRVLNNGLEGLLNANIEGNVLLIKEAMGVALVEGTDYGLIPGTKDPSLDIRLEAFSHQCHEHMRQHSHKK